MASLYEINQAILDCVDLDTGEIIDLDRLQELQIEKKTKLENIALWIKNLESDVKAYKEEENAFKEKRTRTEIKITNLRKYLQDSLNGEKFNTPKVSVTYRRSQVVEFDDESNFVEQAMTKGLDHLLNYKQPTPDKTKIKEYLKNDFEIDGVCLVEKQNMQIK